MAIGARIGLKHGDRLGYWNGTVAPKIKDIEKFFSKSSSTTTEDFTCTLRFSPTQQSTPIIDRIDCSQNDLQEAGSTFIKNKENHQPIFIDKKSNVGTLNETYTKNGKCEQKKCPELEKMLKTYELVSYEKKLYHKYPDTMIKPKIDKHIKSQRALRNVQNQN
ncbi:hypothetical protein HUG17_7627 [Dermatophagoides farinae]|uniref:Uncharacterized protein n=1 Tax=Dermatophagoides farinae TaxID=6954 RepID=A0A9D4NQX2_DERFA|nr:hypothetical protein HUG17_7627 [Dermatophagoides farinae]